MGKRAESTKIPVIDDVLLLGPMTRLLIAVTASDSGRAMPVSRAAQPDLVITEIVISGQEGVETILTRRRDHNRVKIIAIFGLDDEVPIQRA